MTELISSYSNISFGLHNPQAALERAEKLKVKYAEKGIKYLLPNEVWSDNKITEKLKELDKYLKYFIKTGTMCEETLQFAINKILPKEAKDSIVVKDLPKVRESMQKRGYSKNVIDNVVNTSGGLTIPAFGKHSQTEIFVNFADAKGSKENQDLLTGITLHELQHALKRQFQNIIASDNFKQNSIREADRIPINFFHEFEQKFYPYFAYTSKPPCLSDEQFYKELKVSSRNELYEKFAKVLDEVELKNSKSVNQYQYDKKCGKYTKKSFFESLKNSANDEKKSFEIQKNSKNPEDCTYFDFFPKLYSEMARFFANVKKFAQN